MSNNLSIKRGEERASWHQPESFLICVQYKWIRGGGILSAPGPSSLNSQRRKRRGGGGFGVSPVLWGFWQISRSQLLLVKTSASGVKGWMKWVFTTSEKSQEFPRAPTSARWMFFFFFYCRFVLILCSFCLLSPLLFLCDTYTLSLFIPRISSSSISCLTLLFVILK